MEKLDLENCTLEEAKQWLRDRFKKGASCPCCTQLVKLYPLQIHSTLARALIEFYKAAKPNFYAPIHTRDAQRFPIIQECGSFSKLKLWGLITDVENTNPDKKRSGVWMMTDKGKDFVEGRLKVPKKVYYYNSRIINIGGSDAKEMVSIRDCLGKKFSYKELMGDL